VAEQDGHVFVRPGIRVEVQGYVRMLLQVRHFMGARLAVDQEGLALPGEPDRAGLRSQVRAGGGEPDEILSLQMPSGSLAEFSAVVNHVCSDHFAC
jgi:hypothetical protein